MNLIMLDKDLQRKLEQVDIMESQLYRQSILSPDDYQDMLKYAEVLYQTAYEIKKYIKDKAEI